MELANRGDNVISKVLGHYTRLEVVKGSGSYLFDKNGKKYLDFASGIAVTSTGHCHPAVVKAAAKQLKKIIHNCAGVTYNETNIACAEKIQSIVPIKNSRLFFTQSGSEAVEGALKAAKYTSKKEGIIALKRGFHGRTMGAMSITTSKDYYAQGYGALMPHAFIADHSLSAINKINNGNIAAIITEPVQGEAGYVAHDKKFLQALREYCTKENIYLIFDEVQSGFGRTGKMFASDWYKVEPDIMSLAKGIASGFPLGAVVMKQKISDQWDTSKHGGTYTGNLVSCAAALATIDIIKKELPKMAAKTELFTKTITALIKKHPTILKKQTGLGFMIGLQCKNKETTTALMQRGLEKGLLLINCGPEGDTLRLVPPVTISRADLKKGLDIIGVCCESI